MCRLTGTNDRAHGECLKDHRGMCSMPLLKARGTGQVRTECCLLGELPSVACSLYAHRGCRTPRLEDLSLLVASLALPISEILPLDSRPSPMPL